MRESCEPRRVYVIVLMFVHFVGLDKSKWDATEPVRILDMVTVSGIYVIYDLWFLWDPQPWFWEAFCGWPKQVEVPIHRRLGHDTAMWCETCFVGKGFLIKRWYLVCSPFPEFTFSLPLVLFRRVGHGCLVVKERIRMLASIKQRWAQQNA